MVLWHHFPVVGNTSSFGSALKSCTRFIQMCIVVLGVQVSTVAADQNADELPVLFAQLLTAGNAESSMEIEGQIWKLWLDAPDRNSAALLSQISKAMGSGRLDMALRLSNQLIDSSPEFAEAWNKRATIHYLMRNNVASVADIRETVRLEPRHFGAISGLGMIFLRENNLPAALEAFEQVLLISPASSNAQRSVERVRGEMGREI